MFKTEAHTASENVCGGGEKIQEVLECILYKLLAMGVKKTVSC